MRSIAKMIIIILVVSLILPVIGCGKPEEGTKPGLTSDGNKAISGKAQDIPALLEKANSVDNFYSEGTLFQGQATTTWKVWYNGKFVKLEQIENNLSEIFDFENNERITYNGLEGYKGELTEWDLDIVTQYKWVSEEIFEYLKPENAEMLQKMDISEETANGIDCVLVDFIIFSGEENKYYINKENGFVVRQELFSRGGEKVMEFSRSVFETGCVTNADFQLPEGVSFK